jgi:hypothetical protein
MREAQKVDLPAPAGPCGAQSVSVVRRVDKTGDLRNPTITRVPYLLMAGGVAGVLACWRARKVLGRRTRSRGIVKKQLRALGRPLTMAMAGQRGRTGPSAGR